MNTSTFKHVSLALSGAVACVVLSACATPPDQQANATPRERAEATTGSNIPRKNSDVKVVDRDTYENSINRPSAPTTSQGGGR